MKTHLVRLIFVEDEHKKEWGIMNQLDYEMPSEFCLEVFPNILLAHMTYDGYSALCKRLNRKELAIVPSVMYI